MVCLLPGFVNIHTFRLEKDWSKGSEREKDKRLHSIIIALVLCEVICTQGCFYMYKIKQTKCDTYVCHLDMFYSIIEDVLLCGVKRSLWSATRLLGVPALVTRNRLPAAMTNSFLVASEQSTSSCVGAHVAFSCMINPSQACQPLKGVLNHQSCTVNL